MKRSLFIVGSLAAHFSVFLALRSAAMQAPKPKRKPIEMTILEPKKIEPPPPDVPKPKLVKHVDATPPPPKPSNEPPPPPVFGLSLTSTVADSTFNMQVGNTTMTEQQKGPPPQDVRPLSGRGTGGKAPVSLTQLTKMPEKIGECPPGNPASLYTAEARDRGIEGDVIVETELDSDGHVAKTKVLRKLGYGLDEAAASAIRERCKFKPAEVNGEKVGTTVTLTFHFIIEE